MCILVDTNILLRSAQSALDSLGLLAPPEPALAVLPSKSGEGITHPVMSAPCRTMSGA